MTQATASKPDTVTVGLLLEAAQSHQDLAESSLQRLQSHVAGLDEVVRDAVGRTAVAEFGQLADHCAETIESLRRLQRAITLRSLWSAAVIAAAPAAIMTGAAMWLLPTPARLAALRTQQEALQENVQRLSREGARVDLRHCGSDGRLCVRVDRHAPSFGEHADYLIVQGY